MTVETCKIFSKENRHDKNIKNVTDDSMRFEGEKAAFGNNSWKTIVVVFQRWLYPKPSQRLDKWSVTSKEDKWWRTDSKDEWRT